MARDDELTETPGHHRGEVLRIAERFRMPGVDRLETRMTSQKRNRPDQRGRNFRFSLGTTSGGASSFTVGLGPVG